MKTILDYTIEHSGGSSIDYNSMLRDINRLESECAILLVRIEKLERVAEAAKRVMSVTSIAGRPERELKSALDALCQDESEVIFVLGED